MKKSFLRCLFFLAFAAAGIPNVALFSIQAGRDPQPAVRRGMLILKLNSDVPLDRDPSAPVLNKPIPSSRLFGIGSLDSKARLFQVSSVERRLPYCLLGFDASGSLSRIWVIRFPENMDVAEAAEVFSSDPNIAYAEPVPEYRLETVPDDPLFEKMHHLSQIQAERAWDIHKGENGIRPVVIAVVDEAVEWTHPDLAPNVWNNLGEDANGNGLTVVRDGSGWKWDAADLNGTDDDGNGYIDDLIGWDFISKAGGQDNDPSPDYPECTHGTHVAGLAAGATNNALGIAGIGWNVRFMPLKLNSSPDLKIDADPYPAILYAARNGADVINLSWGSYTYSRADEEILRSVSDSGVLVVASAGNQNTGIPHYPSDYYRVISVASVSGRDEKSSFSDFRKSVDVSAPGGENLLLEGIWSTIPGGGYAAVPYWGTSMAAPQVSGLLALLKSYRPDWTAERLAQQLFAACDPVDAINPGYTNGLGYGRINAYRTLTESVSLPFEKLRLDLEVLPIVDANGDHVLDPGENANITFSFFNSAHYAETANAVFTLSCSDPDVEIIKSQYASAVSSNGSKTAINAFQIRASKNATTHMVECRITVSADREIAYGGETVFNVLIIHGGILVWEPSLNHPNTSGAFIKECLDQFGTANVHTNFFPRSLSSFDAVFLSFGSPVPDNRLTGEKADAVIHYVNQGGKCYLEGRFEITPESDREAFLQSFGMFSMRETAAENRIDRLNGRNASIAEGIFFSGSVQPDQRPPIVKAMGSGSNLFSESDYGLVGVQSANESGGKTVYSSYALSGFVDGDLPCTRKDWIRKIMEYFGRMPPQYLVADFTADICTGHAPLTVRFKSLSLASENDPVGTLSWDFDGDGFSDSAGTSNAWTYADSGVYTVRLAADNGSRSSILTQPAFVRVFNGRSSLDFNGLSSRVVVPASSELNLRERVTLSAWISPAGWGEVEGIGFGRILDKNVLSVFIHQSASLQYPDSCLVIALDTADSSFSAFHTPPESINLNQWQHVAVTIDIPAGQVRAYINGIEQSLTNAFDDPKGDFLDNSLHDLFIGNRLELDRAFQGRIDDVWIWNEVLSPEEIHDSMFDPSSIPRQKKAAWLFNEGSGDQVRNTAGPYSDGTAVLCSWRPGSPAAVPSAAAGRSQTEWPEGFELYPGRPNPFNAGITLSYFLPVRARVVLRILNSAGQEVKRLVHGEYQEPGIHILKWQAETWDGKGIASGLYLMCIEAGPPDAPLWKAARKILSIK
ncbi:S8 family serine peptidase [bacterium]|nr:S8 family serine peptidase [bacterium]